MEQLYRRENVMNKERRAELRDINERLTRVYEDLNMVRDG